MKKYLLWFSFSIVLNALGNSLLIKANLGSAPWATAAENLSSVSPFSIGLWVIILNVFSFILSYFMKVKFTFFIVVKSILLTFIFGFLIDFFLYMQDVLYIPSHIGLRYLHLFIGLNLMAIALCIYFQVSSVHLPSDYLIKAFGKLMNNYTVGTMICTSIPILISVIIVIYRQQLLGLGVGTLLFMFGVGFLIDQYNRFISFQKEHLYSETASHS